MIYGRVIGLRDVVTFQGETLAEAKQAFHDSVDDYLELCASRNEAPEKPFSGKFMLRIRPELHRTMVIEAQARKSSLNALIEETLAAAFPSTSVDTDTAEDEQSPRQSKAKALDQKTPAEPKARQAAKAATLKAAKRSR